MSFESVIARVNELHQLLGVSAPATTSTVAAPNGVFASQLAMAQGQSATQLPASATDTTMPLQGGIGPWGIPPMTQPATSPGAQIVQLAQGELGVREEPPGSNDGARIKTYRTSTAGARDTPGPWCAYFVSWLCQQSGVPIGPNGAGTGWVPAIEQWGKENDRWFSGRLPEPGDIVIFERTGDGVGDHTGIVERVDADGTIHTIEGNTGDQNVARRDYTLTGDGIKGFVRPG